MKATRVGKNMAQDFEIASDHKEECAIESEY
jgi:hypothetical protein